MIEMGEYGPAQSRLLKLAGVLKAYFEQRLDLSLELLTDPPREPLIEGVQFDLGLKRRGIWGLRASRPLPEKAQSEISATFHSLLLALVGLDDRRRDLAWLQEALQKSDAGEDENIDNNIIPLHRFLRTKSNGFARPNDKRWMLRLDCLIESPHVSEVHKMAIEMHSHSHRQAFIDYHELDKNERLTVSELLQLGPITIFVPSILELSMQEQEVLRQLIDRDTLQRPLLMVGATIPYSDLRSEAAIHIEFLVLLSRAYIKLTRPFSEYKEKGLIHYFLDSLAQSPT